MKNMISDFVLDAYAIQPRFYVNKLKIILKTPSVYEFLQNSTFTYWVKEKTQKHMERW